MVVSMVCKKSIILFLIFKKRFHALYLKIHLHPKRKGFDQVCRGNGHLPFFGVHSSAHRSKQVGVLRGNDLLRHQVKGADKCLPQLRKEMERTA